MPLTSVLTMALTSSAMSAELRKVNGYLSAGSAAIVAAVCDAQTDATDLPSSDFAAQLRQSILHAAQRHGDVCRKVQLHGLRESGAAPAIDLYRVDDICFAVDFSVLR